MSLRSKDRRSWTLNMLMPILVASFLVSCRSSLTDEDNERLRTLAGKYGKRLEFAANSELYINVKSLSTNDSLLPEDEAIEIYRQFFFDQEQRMRRTAYQYLNVYDNKGKFGYQITFDSHLNKFVQSNTEHY